MLWFITAALVKDRLGVKDWYEWVKMLGIMAVDLVGKESWTVFLTDSMQLTTCGAYSAVIVENVSYRALSVTS